MADCMECGLPYAEHGLDVVLPDHQWRMIHPRNDGLLCGRCLAVRASNLPGAVAIRAVIEFAPPDHYLKPLDIVDGRKACPKCGTPSDLIADAADAEASKDVWECPSCGHQFA